VRHGLKAERLGCDVISMDGFECAGHPGEDDTPNFVLLPVAAAAIKVPLLASGGVGSARSLVAALALGADGVNMGTRFMATKEAPIHDKIKQAIVEGDERGSTHIIRKFRNTSRVYKNSVAMKIREIEARPESTFADIADLVGGAGNKAAYQTGDIEAGTWSAGMVMGLIHDIPTCKELLDGMVAEAKAIVENDLRKAFA
jgi:nitronate monooxygenase